jgi:hypothetical protein
MPATIKYQKNKWRVVEKDGELVKNKDGTPVDGGGHRSGVKAKAQARAINYKSSE